MIDFGVAKALGQKLTDLTMFTGFGEIIGTLEYMSPEQSKFNQQDVDTRSDIYALGVVLYELLTSLTPFDQQRLRAASIDEAVRIINQHQYGNGASIYTQNGYYARRFKLEAQAETHEGDGGELPRDPKPAQANGGLQPQTALARFLA